MKASSPSGVSAGWNWVIWGRSCCGPPIWSTTRSSWSRWSSSSMLSSAMTRSMSRVMRSSVGSPSVEIARASSAVRSMSARVFARPSGPGSSRRSA